jgi:TatD DNase family protein
MTAPCLIDSHCHLDPANFAEGADSVLERARGGGVMGFVCIGVGGLAAAEHACALARSHKDVVATVGVHPHDASQHTVSLESEIERLARHQQVVAIGEIGLDYHYDHSPRARQQEVFRRYIQLAKSVGKPIVVHTRSAPADTLEILA